MSVSDCAPLVYVVDDDEALRDSLAWLLTSAGYRAAAYRTAEVFLADYAPAAASCLVLDVRLPGISGIELLRENCGRRTEAPITKRPLLSDMTHGSKGDTCR